MFTCYNQFSLQLRQQPSSPFLEQSEPLITWPKRHCEDRTCNIIQAALVIAIALFDKVKKTNLKKKVQPTVGHKRRKKGPVFGSGF